MTEQSVHVQHEHDMLTGGRPLYEVSMRCSPQIALRGLQVRVGPCCQDTRRHAAGARCRRIPMTIKVASIGCLAQTAAGAQQLV